LQYSMPSITTYNRAGIPDVSYKSALGMAKSIEANASAHSKDFDKEYVGIINTSDYATLGSTYQTGAPFTVYASASIVF